jgi:hypothetical protein
MTKWLYWDLLQPSLPGGKHVKVLRHLSIRPAGSCHLSAWALSPQCGFSSSIVGNRISMEDQKYKLGVVVETAQAVWAKPSCKWRPVRRGYTTLANRRPVSGDTDPAGRRAP